MKTIESNKATRSDHMIIAYVKMSQPKQLRFQEKLLNDCLNEEGIPQVWKNANVIILHEKRDKECMKKLLTYIATVLYVQVTEKKTDRHRLKQARCLPECKSAETSTKTRTKDVLAE